MDTVQLQSLLYHHPATRLHFGGILARDQLPKCATHTCYIVNFDSSQEAGSHWIAIYFNINGIGEYFDSYGLPPYLSSIKLFLNDNCITWKHNRKRLRGQQTAVCGQYRAYFLLK